MSSFKSFDKNKKRPEFERNAFLFWKFLSKTSWYYLTIRLCSPDKV